MSTVDRLAVPLPKSMRTLERDARGYPIPFIVVRDRLGQPQFTINDGDRVEQCRKKTLCSICGKRITGSPWFVGGSRCFVHERGAFVDPPVHRECGTYAMRVCPFLATPYSNPIDDAKLPPDGLPEGMALHRIRHMQPDQPERFGFGCSANYRIQRPNPVDYLYVVFRWEYVEFWHHGEPIGAPDAALIKQLTA